MRNITNFFLIYFFPLILSFFFGQNLKGQNFKKHSSFGNSFSLSDKKLMVDTIRLKDRRLNTKYLKPGLRQYLVYSQDPKKSNVLGFWFWMRNTRIINYKGEQLFETTQHWYGNDTLNYRVISSLNRVSDYSPIYFSETVHNKVKAFDWSLDKIVGSDSVLNNSEKGFSLDFKVPNFNWNLDIETFEMLPLAKGKVFAINFYDAGLDPPEYIIYKVIGSELVKTYGDELVDCWKLSTDGTHDKEYYSETFWISKKTHEFLKEEDIFNGKYRYKISLPASTYNILNRFNTN